MDSEKTHRLSPEEAKRRFRLAVDEVSLHSWMKQRPYESLGISFAAGLILSLSKPMRRTVLRLLLRII